MTQRETMDDRTLLVDLQHVLEDLKFFSISSVDPQQTEPVLTLKASGTVS